MPNTKHHSTEQVDPSASASLTHLARQQATHSVIPASTQGKLWMLWWVIVLPLWLLGWISEELLEQEHFAFDVPIMQAVHGYAMARLRRDWIIDCRWAAGNEWRQCAVGGAGVAL